MRRVQRKNDSDHVVALQLMDAARGKKAATYDDLVALPENLVGEIVDGDLYASPRPASPHAVAKTALGEELGPPFKRGRGGPGGWFILYEPELHIGGQVMVPDLAGWRRERMPVIADVPFFELAPDWLCEVISPGSAALDRNRKMPHYFRAGVTHVWLVDPITKTLEIFQGVPGEGWRLVGNFVGDDKIRAVPFDAVELDLSVLWAR